MDSQIDPNRIYRARKTCAQMLTDRGYVVPQVDRELTYDQFKDAGPLGFCVAAVEGSEMPQVRPERLPMVVPRADDPTDQIFVFFALDSKLGIDKLKQFHTDMLEKKVNRAIIILHEGISPFAKTALAEMASKKHIFELFQESELQVNITKHVLVPQHVPLTPEEKTALLQRYKLKDAQLPRIQFSDPVARYFGLQRGNVVKIIRPSETAGRYVTYRLVV